MTFNEEMRPTNNVRSSLTSLQRAMEDLPGGACIASAYLPRNNACDGLAGGSPDVLPFVVEDTMVRALEYLTDMHGPDAARKILIEAFEKALGRRVDLGGPAEETVS